MKVQQVKRGVIVQLKRSTRVGDKHIKAGRQGKIVDYELPNGDGRRKLPVVRFRGVKGTVNVRDLEVVDESRK